MTKTGVKLGSLAGLTSVLGAIGLFGLADPAQAAKGVQYQGDICKTHTQRRERLKQIPRHLLGAISLAETGRWNEDLKASFAWPWTVTARGGGRFFATKQLAIAATQKLMDQGFTSIDVGCMQINMHFHPRAFPDLQAAFDPATNVAYAANFLIGLHKETGDWQSAAAHYHSSNAAHNRDYQKKVVSLWNKARKRSSGSAQRVAYQAPLKPYAGGKRDLTRLLNTRFRGRLRAERQLHKGEKHSKQLDKWRKARLDPSVMSQMAVRRQADRERVRKAKLETDRVDFATKRLNQLAAWRKKKFWKPAAR
ncbi:MAG: transglycosylase SLT domain-containing protein [Rhodospirillales bacterium]|nr:transglycosylase SLT domain-containing protein [Rhodospirillales bacterium]